MVGKPVRQNWRGMLNNWVQTNPGRCSSPPEFTMNSETGQPHDKVFKFHCKVTLDSKEQITEGVGASKKIAKSECAKNMFAVFAGVDVSSLTDATPATPVPAAGAAAQQQSSPQEPKAPRPTNAHVPDQSRNFIGQLNEFVQTHQHLSPTRPVFEPVINPTQAPGTPFTMKATMKLGDEEKSATGQGRKKKEAKQNAAQALLAQLPIDPNRKKRKKNFGGRGANKRHNTAGLGYTATVNLGQNSMGAMGIHSDLAQKAEAAYKEYTAAVSNGDDADELYAKYREIYQEYANEYAKTYQAQLAPESRVKMQQGNGPAKTAETPAEPAPMETAASA